MTHPIRLWATAGSVYLAVTALRLFIVRMLADAKGQTLNFVLSRWDAIHYMGIARGGYFESMDPNSLDGYHTRLAFFPLYPFSIRLVHEVTGLSYLTSGIALNVVAGIVLVAGVMMIAQHMGAGLLGQAVAGLFVFAAPMGLTYTMAYTEAFFTAFACWALWAMLTRRWWLAGTLVFFTCLTRLTGIDLWIVFALVVLVYGRRSLVAWVSLVLSPLGMVAYILFVNSHTADVGGYFGLQRKGWKSEFDWGHSTLGYLKWIFNLNADSWIVLIGLFVLASVALVVLTWGSVPWPVWLFAAGVTANILLSDGTFTARPRLLLPATLLLIPVALAFVRSVDRYRVAFGCVAWVVVGAVISAHPLVATGWAI